MERHAVRVESIAGRTYSTLLTSGAHALLADEPVAYDGDDLGPSPMNLAMLALGSCASITLQMYARRKGWSLDRGAIDVIHEVVEGEGRRSDRIERRVTLEGDLTVEQRQRLLDVAGRCPVAKLMRGNPEIIDIEKS